MSEPTVDDLLAIGDRIVGWAKDGEQLEAVVVRSRDTEIRAYEGEVEQLSSAQTQGIGIRVVRDQRVGFAYAGSLDDDVLGETLEEARDNAGFGTPDEFVGLATPDGVPVADLDLFCESLADFPTDSKVELAIALERAARAADPRISGVESADYVDSIAEGAVVTSTGIRTAARETAAYIMASVLAAEGDETQTGFGFSVGRDPRDLDLDKAAADAADRATRMLGATKPPSQRVTVVLDPWVTAQLLGIIGGTLSGEAVLKGRSPFADRLGDEIGNGLLTLVDDPTNPEAFTATQTDGEGLATRRNPLIEGGVLKGFLHNSYTARRLGTVSTGSAVRGFKSTPSAGARAVALLPGTKSQAELVAEVGDGILVQSVSGLHSGVNPVSGDFSTGAQGLRIEGGAVGAPLREFTIASTLQRILHDVLAVGGDIEWLPMAAAGVSLVIGDVTVSGS
ncbi:MAG: PmbA protein [Acidimicrobiaceae bacterium]